MSAKSFLLACRVGELLCYVMGILLTAFFVAQLAQGEVQRKGDMAQFQQLAQTQASDPIFSAINVESSSGADASSAFDLVALGEPDTSLWNAGRVADYKASMKAQLPEVLGILDLPSVGLKVPIYATNTALVMDRGTGIIDGMAYPHEEGNIGISGHRDGYFRVLKDVKIGDTVVLQTLKGPKNFSVTAIDIVDRADETLLRDTDEQSVTLVTCYPFYFVGHAPKRYIVTASLDTTGVTQK